MGRQIEIGGWEHECCGPAFELGQLVELSCVRNATGVDGGKRLIESHHRTVPTMTVRGRVVHLEVIHDDGTRDSIVRIPSGRALCGFDDEDDGHLENPWTHARIEVDSPQFVMTLG